MTPIVAIVGRPNVGKSTLWNRVTNSRRAIVEDVPGVTRDRLVALTTWSGRTFEIVDTGGWMPGETERLWDAVRAQVERAVRDAAVVILVVDGRDETNPSDRAIADHLRRRGTPVVLAVNKVDEPGAPPANWSFSRLGFRDLFPISALAGHGVAELLDSVTARLPPPGADDAPAEEAIRVAIVGRPNVGKSSILNALLGDSRAVVDSRPGTTRDATDTFLRTEKGAFILVDTAGLRKRMKVDERLEQYSADRTLAALRRCDVALLVLDPVEGAGSQDAAIGAKIIEAGKGCAILWNKWDLVSDETRKHADRAAERLREAMPFLDFAPVVTCSAKTGQRLERLLAAAAYVSEQHNMRLSTSQVNAVLEQALAKRSIPTRGGHPVRIKYATQASVRPPTFILFANHPESVAPAWLRFFTKLLRATWGFEGTPIRIELRGGSKKGKRR